MLELFLAFIGGAEMIIGGLAWRYDWSARTWAWFFVVAGIITVFGGLWVWDYEERKEHWQLSERQRLKLGVALAARGEMGRFPLAFFPINGHPLATTYSYDVLDAFIKHRWKYVYVSPNLVIPNSAFGLEIRTCPDRWQVSRFSKSPTGSLLLPLAPSWPSWARR